MFCLMDVSASMDEDKKDLAKRFFTLLYLFLTRKYEEVELVFIRHTDDAEEVDEDTFFHDARSGGTVVYSALELADKIRGAPSAPAGRISKYMGIIVTMRNSLSASGSSCLPRSVIELRERASRPST